MPIGDLFGGGAGAVQKIFAGIGAFAKGLVFFLVFGIVVGVITYLIVNRKAYNKKIHIWEEVNGATTPVGSDLAREMRVPGTSIRIFKLKKRGLWLPRPSKQFGKGNYLYFITRDGEWRNVGVENLNKKLDELKIDLDIQDMKYANASLKKLVESSYKKQHWLKEYAPYIAFGVLILLVGISFYLVADKNAKAMGGVSTAIDNTGKLIESTTQLIEVSKNIGASCQISGIASAPG